MKNSSFIIFIFFCFNNYVVAENIDTDINNEIIVEEEFEIDEVPEEKENIQSIKQQEPEKKTIIEEKEEVKIKIGEVDKNNIAKKVRFLALNKITTKSYKYEVNVGDSINFERLNVRVLFCWKSSPDELKENKVLLKISETSVSKEETVVFYGWMFSSSQGLSTLEHSMYDITIVDCE